MADGCYVYLTLPGAVQATLAGRYALDQARGVGRFVYGRSYLANPDRVEIDPIELPLSTRPFETAALGGVFGPLRDAAPDSWGRRIIERHRGGVLTSELDYLLAAPSDGAGALGFGLNQAPPAPERRFNRTIDLERLQRLAEAVLATDKDVSPTDPDAVQVREMLLLGTSMGGARPKAVVEDDDGLWLAKFRRLDDKWNDPRVEAAMLTLARACGIEVPEHRVASVADRDVLLVARFDRRETPLGYNRLRMVSALTILRAEDTHRSRGSWSYLGLADEILRISVDLRRDQEQLFRRMCFNALISNTDDHPRNHAFIADDRGWRLSPAYDLTPTPLVSVERRDLAMTCGRFGRLANRDNLLSEAARFSLGQEAAVAIVDEIEMLVRDRWYSTARSAGVTDGDCTAIRGAFNYEGFRMPLRS